MGEERLRVMPRQSKTIFLFWVIIRIWEEERRRGGLPRGRING